MKFVSIDNLKRYHSNSKKAFGNMSKVTYAELKNLRDNSKLVEGKFYRITDFVTTVDQEDAMSAGHAFDIIVLATSPNTLNENAFATQNNDTTYFSQSNLDAWELKYDLDNDKSKYAWADETNGKGVIYYMKDEFNNECPYDFKNVLFKRWAITDITSNFLTTSELQDLNNTFNFTINGGKHFASKNAYGSWEPSFQDADITVDESNSAWYYTFNGMSSNDGKTIDEMYDVSTKHIKLTEECIEYLKGDGSGSNFEDACYDNVIAACHNEYLIDDLYYKGRMILNNIVFNNGLSYCYYNEADDYWNYNTAYCFNNRFDNDCHNNTFGESCSSNIFGESCSNNTFGNDCSSNKFGESCSSNIFGESCSSNIFGESCHENTFRYSCCSNTFENVCQSNTFGSNCSKNTFGESCHDNEFKNNCDYNKFENDCYGNTFTAWFQFNQIKPSGAQAMSFKLYTTGFSMRIRFLTIYYTGVYKTIPADLITLDANYSQVLGLNSAGELVCKPALD